jgi:AcrR family transcriptional regulator
MFVSHGLAEIPERKPDAHDLDLIDASEVAELLGLAHRNSVSTYRSRYPDFPVGRAAPGGGRTRLWRREEVVAWREHFHGRHTSPSDEESPKRQQMVKATARLLLSHPGTEVSIRQIATEAGVAHSDLYRYATSKEQLRRLAVDAISNEFAELVPETWEELVEALGGLLEGSRELRPMMAVLAHEMISQPGQPLSHDLAIRHIARVLEQHRAETGEESEVDTLTAAACLGAMAWGLWLFEERWMKGLGLTELDNAQIAKVARAILET